MSLYHLYRPQRFVDVVGQEVITQTITNQITHDRLAHAYLFAGPRGVGKTTTARIMARAVNCENRGDSPEPCNACASCTRILDGKSIDIIEIDAASHTGVENVRQNIIENAQFRPTQAKKKVFIIDEVHMLSTSAFNALLKTLEEPPPYVLFVLATTELHKIPETIISRCQRFSFKKIMPQKMREELIQIAEKESVKIDTTVLDRVVVKSDGCMRDGVTLLDQLLSSGEKNITPAIASLFLPTSNYEHIIAIIESLIAKDSAQTLTKIKDTLNDGATIKTVAEDIVLLLRYLLLYQSNPKLAVEELDLSTDQHTALNQIAAQIQPTALVTLLELMMKRMNEMYAAPLPTLPIEMAIIAWCADSTQAATAAKIPPVSVAKQPNTIAPPVAVAAPKKTAKAKRETPVATKTPEPVETVTKSATPPPVETPTPSPVATTDDIQAAWAQTQQALLRTHPTLTMIISGATIAAGAEPNAVTIFVASVFHQEKLAQPTTQQLLQAELEKSLAYKPIITIAIKQSGQAASTADTPSIDDMAELLGGQVVA